MSYEDLYPHQVTDFVKQNGVIVIDIRDVHSYNAGHMTNALHIDGPTMGRLIKQRKANPPVLIYCYHGNSSRDMAEMIARLGFTKVSHLVGGWEAWMHYQAGQEVDQSLFGSSLSPAFA